MRCIPRVTACAAALMMFLMAANVDCAWEFNVWNGLADVLQVEDDAVASGTMLTFTRDEGSLTSYDETVYLTPTPDEEKNADCEVGLRLFHPVFKFRDATADKPEGYAAYVYKHGFFGANDNQGTGTPLSTWPSQCVLT